MNATPNIDQLMQRTRRYWYEDGLWEIALGCFFVVLGLFLWTQSLTPPGSPLWIVWGLGGPILIIGGGLVAIWIVKQIKSRFTYPRTGYVTYEHRAKGFSGWIRIAGVVIVGALVAVLIVIAPGRWHNYSLLFGLAGLVVFGVVGYTHGLRRFSVLALWSLILGVVLLPLSAEQGGALFYIGLGLGTIVAGGITWHRYNQVAPPPQEVADDATV